MIESKANSQIKRIQRIQKSARFRRQERCFVAEGWKLTKEALRRHMVQAVYISENAKREWQKCKESENAAMSVPVEVVSDKVFEELSDTVTPQGVLSVVTMPVYERTQLTSGAQAALLCLEDIQDPGNMGTMIRTAEGAGMTGIVVSGGCVDLFNPKVVRAAMGALFRMPFYLCGNMTEEAEKLHKEGFTLYAAHLRGSVLYTEADYAGKTGILIGNEANGLSEEVSRQADCKVRIPMEGELESLNAAVSAALFMYEIHRNRG